MVEIRATVPPPPPRLQPKLFLRFKNIHTTAFYVWPEQTKPQRQENGFFYLFMLTLILTGLKRFHDPSSPRSCSATISLLTFIEHLSCAQTYYAHLFLMHIPCLEEKTPKRVTCTQSRIKINTTEKQRQEEGRRGIWAGSIWQRGGHHVSERGELWSSKIKPQEVFCLPRARKTSMPLPP